MKPSNDFSTMVLVPESLRAELRRLVNVEYDNVVNDILAYIITRGPVTLYRVSRETPYSISSIYKKARYMVKNNLLSPRELNGKHMYEITVKGLITCLAYKCLDDEVVLSKLRVRWNLRNYDMHGLVSILTVLSYIARNENLGVLENIDALMITALSTLINNPTMISKFIDERTITNVKNSLIHYLINNVINGMPNNKKPDIILGNNSFLVGYHKNTRSFYVYMCTLCEKNCVLTFITCNDGHGCPLITELSKDVLNAVK